MLVKTWPLGVRDVALQQLSFVERVVLRVADDADDRPPSLVAELNPLS